MAAPTGVAVAYGQDALAATPTWTRVDDPAGIHVVTGWRTKRGRTYMTNRTDAGTAEIDFVDTVGKLDPTNPSGPFYPMDPNCPAAICLWNPVTSAWTQVFAGLVQQIPTTVDVSEKVSRGTLHLTDFFSLLGLAEVPPGVAFDDTGTGANSPITVGETTYEPQQVDDRIKAILADVDFPSGLTSIFSGNVNLQFTVVPPGTQVLAALQDAADAEFPGVANLFISKGSSSGQGHVIFHGRLARFNPTNPTYGINTWNVGDHTAVAAHSTYALVAGLTFDRDIDRIINAARFSPDNIADADIAGQLVVDSGSITQFGNRTGDFSTGENMVTGNGLNDGLAKNAETKLFATYYVDNFHDAQNHIQQLTFRWVPPTAANATAHWAFLCGVEIGDVVNVTVTNPGGGGFNAVPYFVEGISYDALPGPKFSGNPIADVTMTLDLSPEAYFTTDPFS